MIKPSFLIKPPLYVALALLAPLTTTTAQQKTPLAPLAPLTLQPSALAQNNYRSIVRIEAATQVPDYREPWKAGRFSGGIGTGAR